VTKAPPLDRLVPAYIRRFQAYLPSKPDQELKKLYGCSRLYRLNNNENALGPPPGAQDAIRAFPPPQASIYPSGDAYYLRCQLAERFGMAPEQFLVGNGANEAITFVIKAFCQEGDNIITADKTFAVYEWVAEFSGFEARLVPLKDFGFDAEGMLQKIDERTKILFLCNPNNPTGSFWSLEQLRRFLDHIDGSQIVVVDEAYAEFVEDPSYPDGMALISEYPNLVVFRTFSKMYALAGLRIGYLAGSREVVDIIRRTCVVYSVNVLADGGPRRPRRQRRARGAHPGAGQAGQSLPGKRGRNPGASLCPGRRQLHDDQAAHERCSGLPEAHDPRGHGARHDRFSLSQLDPGDDIPPRSHGGTGGGPWPNARQSRKGKLMAESEEHLIKPGRKWEIALLPLHPHGALARH